MVDGKFHHRSRILHRRLDLGRTGRTSERLAGTLVRSRILPSRAFNRVESSLSNLILPEEMKCQMPQSFTVQGSARRKVRQ